MGLNPSKLELDLVISLSGDSLNVQYFLVCFIYSFRQPLPLRLLSFLRQAQQLVMFLYLFFQLSKLCNRVSSVRIETLFLP